MKPPSDPVLDWLLEPADPGVRYFALRDLLGAPEEDADVRAARRATLRTSPVREILAAQREDGSWPGTRPGYAPKYRGSVWSVIFLGQFGADGADARVRRAGDYVLDNTRAPQPYGGFSCNATPTYLIHCLQGNLCASLLALGFQDDPRLQQALDWLARSITGEGIAPAKQSKASPRYYRSGNSGPGFLCSANSHSACAWGAIPALEALSRVPIQRRTPAVRRAIAAGIEFLLGAELASGAYPTPTGGPPSASWFRFGYPIGYVQDVLHGLEVLTALGQVTDPIVLRAADLVAGKQDASGRWLMTYSYNGKMWSDVEGKRRPSKWVTLRARRVFRRLGAQG